MSIYSEEIDKLDKDLMEKETRIVGLEKQIEDLQLRIAIKDDIITGWHLTDKAKTEVIQEKDKEIAELYSQAIIYTDGMVRQHLQIEQLLSKHNAMIEEINKIYVYKRGAGYYEVVKQSDIEAIIKKYEVK